MTTALVPVTVGTIGTQTGIQTVNGRDLHQGLGVEYSYNVWMRDQIDSLQLVENEDYVISKEKLENSGRGRPPTEFYLTLDTGKHIAMASRTPKGRAVRAYFIQVEKDHMARFQPMTMAEAIAATGQVLVKHERQLMALEERVGLLDGATGYTSLAVYIKRERFKYPGGETAKAMGAYASKLSRELGEVIEKVPHSQYGTVNGYTESVCAQTCEAFGLKRKGA